VTIRTGHLAKLKSLSNLTFMPGKLLKKVKTFTCKQPPHRQSFCTESSKLRRISSRHRLSRTLWTSMEMLHLERCLQWSCCLVKLSAKLNTIGQAASLRDRYGADVMCSINYFSSLQLFLKIFTFDTAKQNLEQGTNWCTGELRIKI